MAVGTEEVTETSQDQAAILSPEKFLIPKGYKLVTVGAEKQSDVKAHCGSCGAPASFFWSECGYCETPKSHLMFQKVGEIRTEGFSGLAPGRTIVNRHEIQGQIASEEVDIGFGATVGAIFGETVSLDGENRVGSVTSRELIANRKCDVQEAIVQHASLGNSTNVEQLTILDNGSISLQKRNRIKLLRVGENVGLPSFHRTVQIGKIEHGSFAFPQFLVPQPK